MTVEPNGQGNGLVAGVSCVRTLYPPCRADRCPLNGSRLKRPYVGVMWNHIFDCTPSSALNISNLAIPNFLQLADPTFCKPGRINVLIGCQWVSQILKKMAFLQRHTASTASIPFL
ncbi:hypothetical protein TNCV_2311221 [Trichonephila clavipes]|nr:hypothetical protein TNCV_2311221 [Trichonephila clavipes]